MNFIGVDGEGVTDKNGNHRYVLFGCGDRQIEDSAGLRWSDVFQFLYGERKARTAFCGFYLGYDFTQLFRTLPETKAFMLLTSEGRALRKHKRPGHAPHPVQCEDWQFDVLAMKRLRLRPKDCECENATCGCEFKPWLYVCDTGPFFQTSFLNVINPKDWPEGTCPVSAEEYAEIERGKAARSTAVLDDEMRRYNRLENTVLSRTLSTLDRGLLALGVHLPPAKWFGPGQAAQAWLKSQAVPTGEEIRKAVPPWFMEAARCSYFGGWFEIFMHGHIGDAHEYDINSAYPSIIQNLPCLLHGRYTRGNGHPQMADDEIALVYASVDSPGMPRNSPPIGTMLHRDNAGRILRPSATEGWYWWHELQAAYAAGLVKRPNGKTVHRWVKYSPCDCSAPMAGIAGLYDKRLSVGKTSPLGKASKLVYNSAYGKFAQSVGDPIFGNPVYASLITAGCRTLILQAIATHSGGLRDVAMVATDALFFCTPHTGLSLSDRLGEWDYKQRTNLTLFKPGVYWDDTTRQQIKSGESPTFKARGFKASDFASSLGYVDTEFDRLRDIAAKGELGSTDWEWPSVEFVSNFSMTTALQALRRGDWNTAGQVSSATPLRQNSNPAEKRTGVYVEKYRGRTLIRSRPHFGMHMADDGESLSLRPIPSHPYEKRFGMDDPFSEEYRSQFGITEDGDITQILAWLLKGE